MDFFPYKTPGCLRDHLRTEKCFKDCADCGFNVFFLTGKNSYCKYGEEPWETSNSKKCFGLAKKAGIKRIVLRDDRLYEQLIQLKDKLVGQEEDCRFHSETELDEYVRYCMKDYIKEPEFYGLGLLDEPTYEHLKSCGHVYRSIKRVAKEYGKDDIYIQVNFNPMLAGAYHLMAPEGYKKRTEEGIYESYIEAFIKELQLPLIFVDNYPFRPSIEGGLFLPGYYSCFQILQRQCKKHGVKLGFVLQSFEMYHKTKPGARIAYRRVSNINEMFLQMNSALGFGVKEMAFYTYTTEYSDFYRIEDGSSFVTSKGEKTNIYKWGKAAIAHAQTLSSTLLEYDFEGARISLGEDMKAYENNYCGSEGVYLGADENGEDIMTPPSGKFDNTYEFDKIAEFSHDGGAMLVTELKKGEKNYIYMVQNITDTPYRTTLVPMKIKISFNNCKKIKIFKIKVWEDFTLGKDGVFEGTLEQGEAIYFKV